MKHRFLIHSINHTILVVDITPVPLPTEIYPSEGRAMKLDALRFQAWKDAEQYFLGLGASTEALKEIPDQLKSIGLKVLTVV